jgi:SAM-dependent MidA family methyltransferase
VNIAQTSSSLPAPSPEAQAVSHALTQQIAQEITLAGGWLPFDRYMQLALYAPGLGYYTAGAAKFAEAGDFTTAPEMSPLFGASLASQVAEVLQREGLNAVLEFGAGTGKLAAQMLNTLRSKHGLSPQYSILDVSPDLRERQARSLQALAPANAAQVQWLDQLPEQFEGVVIANEVLDAMPVKLLVKLSDGWAERGVVCGADGMLSYDDRASAVAPAVDWAAQLPTGYLTELHRQAEGFVRSMGAWFKRGVALLFDYGFPESEYYHPQRSAGTLMCHYRHHAHGNALLMPGLQDITSHINFTGIALAAQEAGLDVLGYTSQAHFLINCGVLDLLKRIDEPDELARLKHTSAVQKLLAETEMGELFKVLVLGKGVGAPLRGTAHADRTHRL